jgi:hypothetical protein
MDGMVAAAPNPRAWAPLRLLRAWRGSDQTAEPAGIAPIDMPISLPTLPPDLTVVWQADAAFARRTASVALRDVLSQWREAERSLSAMSAESGEFTRVEGEVVVLRAAYQRRFEAIRARLRDE